MNFAIESDELGKRYPGVTAVENLSLRVAEGEIYAFLGLNGAGKTTTIRMLLGMIRPTTGRACVLQTEVRPGRREPWGRVGYLVETARAYPELSVRENLEAARRLHPGVPPQAVSRYIEQLGLAPYAERRAGTLSLGNAQRLGLAKALLHEPRLLILDEPANGLDPAGIVEIREMLLELAHERGVTIFMSSHILGEVARLAQRIGIIHRGRLVRELDSAALEGERIRRLLVRCGDTALASTILAGHDPILRADNVFELTGASAVEHPDEIASLLVWGGAPPTHLVVEHEDLEHYFLRVIGMQAEGGPR
jgi:ABC-2 type transport system ATP-binding protein